MKALSRLENHFNSLSEQRKNRLEWREVGGVLFSSSGCPQSCAEALSLCSQTVPVPLLLLPRVRTCRDHKASLTHHLVINTSLTPLSQQKSHTIFSPEERLQKFHHHHHHLNTPSSVKNPEFFQKASTGFSWKKSIGDISSPRTSTDF